ncbi:MAG TPA: aldehyde dehydrogenase family protein [Candidatus Baltobacteraceae bacterium]|nr:aldehyde dehydrogenase family protein [Candidatus Baltobacteraceae bacterium]
MTVATTHRAYEFGSLLGGGWRYAGQEFVTANPARPSERVGTYQTASERDLTKAADAALSAQRAWARVPAAERARVVGLFLDAVEARTGEIALAITREQGKPLAESRGEIGKSLREARTMLGEALRVGTAAAGSGRPGVRNVVTRRPRGVIAAITPWNFPILTPMRKIVPALVFGNAIVLKPSEVAPAAACLVADASRGIVPDGLLQIVNGGGDVGRALVDLPVASGVTFTGSVEVGRAVYAAAALRLAEVSLELGGKNAAIVHDVDSLDAALDHITGAAMLCSGQRCTAISRVLVRRELHDAVVEGLVRRAQAFVLGDGTTEGTTLGPLVTSRQRDRVEAMVERAIAEGARAATGGRRGTVAGLDDGFFYEPTILVDVSPENVAAREEIFGPVVAVLPYDDLDEAFTLLNGVEYGLTAALFSHEQRAIARFVDECETGMLHVNHGTVPDDHMPFGGIKASGVGAPSVGPSAASFYTTEHAVYLGV